MSILAEKKWPHSLKKLNLSQLKEVVAEIRRRIIEVVSANGGHLASSLGSVELTVALHTVLNTPTDKVLWDVGHQTYAHKIITGRGDQFATLRQYKGLSGFIKPEESEFDTFSVGHASTAISAAVGIARARDIRGEDFSVFSIVGDGSFSGGMIFEALNNCQELNNFVVILNDNGMSISKPVGTLSSIITRLRVSGLYTGMKHNTEKILDRVPMIGPPVKNIIERLVNRTGEMIVKELGKKEYAGFFQDMGFTYIGPIDGHNISFLMAAIKYAKKCKKPILLHVNTKKGRGFLPAEQDPTNYHGVGAFDPETGDVCKDKNCTAYTTIFAQQLVQEAQADSTVCAITAAMCEGTGLGAFAEQFPERYFDVGIAEEHAITFAGGLAIEGLKPVVAIYSTFLQRGYDQIIHDIALQKLPVFFAVDRAGLVGEDGPTHHGVFDISFLRSVPNLVVAAPKDANELKDLVKTGLAWGAPFAVRYPRGAAPFSEGQRDARLLAVGKGEVVHGSLGESECVIWAVGSMVERAVKAAKRSMKKVLVVNARFVKPLDVDLLVASLKNAQKLITIEENALPGGFGSAILEALAELNCHLPVKRLGIPDSFIEHGSVEILQKLCGLDEASILAQIDA